MSDQPNPCWGSTLDDFLKEEGIYETARTTAILRVVAWQLAQEMERQGLSKTELAARMHTSRAQLDRVLNALAATQADVGQARDFVRHVMHVVQRHGLCRVLDQVGHIVHRVDERVDLLTVDGGDESLVQGAVDFVRHAVGSALGVVDVLVVLVAQMGVVVIGDQLGKCTCCLDNALRMLVEHLEKIALLGQQLSKQHANS